MARMFKVLLTVMLVSWLAGCASSGISSPQQIQEAINTTAPSVKQYVLGPSDVIEVSVWRNPDLSVSVPVRPDGKISVPLIGDVQAAGETPDMLAKSIQKQLGAYIREPQVSIIVKDMGSHEYSDRVRVTGAVKNPTSVPFRAGMTVLDVVLGAGGVNEFAAPNKAVLYRTVSGHVVAIPVHLDDILHNGDIKTNYRMQPGDILTVPERLF